MMFLNDEGLPSLMASLPTFLDIFMDLGNVLHWGALMHVKMSKKGVGASHEGYHS